jgi:hypothetical protein
MWKTAAPRPVEPSEPPRKTGRGRPGASRATDGTGWEAAPSAEPEVEAAPEAGQFLDFQFEKEQEELPQPAPKQVIMEEPARPEFEADSWFSGGRKLAADNFEEEAAGQPTGSAVVPGMRSRFDKVKTMQAKQDIVLENSWDEDSD